MSKTDAFFYEWVNKLGISKQHPEYDAFVEIAKKAYSEGYDDGYQDAYDRYDDN